MLNDSMLTKCSVKFFSRSKIGPVPGELSLRVEAKRKLW